ncbi:tail fiber assembly protein [Citrobacter freundii]|uniref:tail fiber assembly protein n=1 Tax=Citrobacter freundii TaxID=546 RepID=UPI0025CB60CB|nr:tail fiber assembly protein [Citrobacter freundii]MDN4239224.1 tail fiber assembly protein [Citrobacter freundii]MDN4319775.1 tail fiber assembly protein [Citrobacter freundii]
MKYKYCSKTNMFYPFAMKNDYIAAGVWPENGQDVNEDVFSEFTGQPPTGKTRVAGIDGFPAWDDIQPPTAEQIAAFAAQQKTTLLTEASAIIAPLKDALDGGYIDDEDKPGLTAWQKYRYALTKVNLAKPVWPDKPE